MQLIKGPLSLLNNSFVQIAISVLLLQKAIVLLKSTAVFGAISKQIIAVAMSIQLVGVKATVANGSLIITKGILGAIAAHPVVATLLAMGAAFTVLKGQSDKAKEALGEYQTKIESLEGVSTQLSNIEDRLNDSTSSEERLSISSELLELQKKLNDEYGITVRILKTQDNSKLQEQVKQMQSLVDMAEKKTALNFLEEVGDTSYKSFKKVYTFFDFILDPEAWFSQDKVNEKYDEMIDNVTDNLIKSNIKIKNGIKDLQELINDPDITSDKIENVYQSILGKIEDSDMIDDNKELVKEKVKEYYEDVKEAVKEELDAQKVEKATGEGGNFQGLMESFFGDEEKEINGIRSKISTAMSKGLNSDWFREQINKIKDENGFADINILNELMPELLEEGNWNFLNGFVQMSKTLDIPLESLLNIMMQLHPELASVSDSTMNLKNVMSSFSDEIGSVQEAYDALTGAVDEYNDAGYMSIDTLNSLIDTGAIAYLEWENGQLVANTNELYNNADAQKVAALSNLQTAFAKDAVAIATGNVEKQSSLAKAALEGEKGEIEGLGTIAAAQAGGLFTLAMAQEAVAKSKNGDKIDVDSKEKELTKLTEVYNKAAQGIASISIGDPVNRTSRYTGSGTGSKGSSPKKSSSSSSKSEKEWWETELQNLKDQFSYNETTIDEYINGLSNLLGRVQQGTDAWKKINEELQKQRLTKVEDDYKRGIISLDEYIKKLRELASAYREGTDAWNDLADKIKSALKDKAEEQKDKYETAESAAVKLIDDEIEKLNKLKDEQEEYYDKLIEDKQKANEETEKEIELARLQDALENAKKEKVKKIWKEGIGWQYEADQQAIKDAQKELDDFQNEQEISELEKQKEEALKVIDDQIKAWDDYKEKWEDVADDYETQQARMVLAQQLGADAEANILNQRLEALEKYKNGYLATMNAIKAIEDTPSTVITSNPGSIPGFSDGGVVDYTGLAMVHGSPNSPEYVLNNDQMRNFIKTFTRPQTSSNVSGFGNSGDVYNFNGNIELPNVDNAKQFVTGLKSYINITKHQ